MGLAPTATAPVSTLSEDGRGCPGLPNHNGPPLHIPVLPCRLEGRDVHSLPGRAFDAHLEAAPAAGLTEVNLAFDTVVYLPSSPSKDHAPQKLVYV